MNTPSTPAAHTEGAGDPAPAGSLSIGDLAGRTGISPATIRMWEQRHGFPQPQRLESGHRRYAETDVQAVHRVVQRRDAGVRLDVAIAEAIAGAIAGAQPKSPSIFAELRRRHPHLAVHRLRKSTLLALSWAIEDEFCAKASDAHVFGSFQHEHYYEKASARWEELARVARSAFVYADFPSGVGDRPTPVRVPLDSSAPMRREWAVVCDSVDLPVALTAWEIPGQGDQRDADRIFESLWTLDPQAVRDASRVCAHVAGEVDPTSVAPLLYDLAGDPDPGTTDLAAVTTMFNRVVAYVDRFGS